MSEAETAAAPITPPLTAPPAIDATPDAPWRILCVDDEANILNSLRRLFRQHGYQISVAGGGAEG
ncbi:MAG: hypothetical protein QG584_2625, partial [Pseudomonadota bacterium]|nr:hypothetical protein [Pseudomonadota bacterium]